MYASGRTMCVVVVVVVVVVIVQSGNRDMVNTRNRRSMAPSSPSTCEPLSSLALSSSFHGVVVHDSGNGEQTTRGREGAAVHDQAEADDNDFVCSKKKEDVRLSSQSSSSLPPPGVRSRVCTNLLRRLAAEIDRVMTRVDNMSRLGQLCFYALAFSALLVSFRVVRVGSFRAALRLEKQRIEAGHGWATSKMSAAYKAAVADLTLTGAGDGAGAGAGEVSQRQWWAGHGEKPKVGSTKATATEKKRSEKYVLSYSLYGENPRYTDGMLENARLAREVYGPEWTVRVYHDNTVPADVLRRLGSELGVELVDMTKFHEKLKKRNRTGLRSEFSNSSNEPNRMVWRFGVASDPTVDRYCVRDGDSRLTPREKAAVDEWIESGRKFHVMRDHPSHSLFGISGGLWCGTRDAFPGMVDVLREWDRSGNMNGKYMNDMDFLNRIVWPVAADGGGKRKVLQHDAFSCDKFEGAMPFPTRRVGWEHVGGVYIDGQLREYDVQLLRDAFQPEQCRDRDPAAEVVDAETSEANKVVEGGIWRGEWYLEEEKDGDWRERTATGRGETLQHEGPSETDQSKFCFRRAPPPLSGERPERKGQVTSETAFGIALRDLARQSDVKRVLEIGTWYGGGSTQSFVEGLKDKSNCDMISDTEQCCEGFVITFEIHTPAWEHARAFHRDNPVWLVHGTTVGVEDMLRDDQIPESEKLEHYNLYYKRDKELMARETPQMGKYCKMVRPDVVLIDGNEYTGWGEFQMTMTKCKPKYIALHDTGTLKTRLVEEAIKKNPEMFRKVSSGRGKAGWSIHKLVYDDNDRPKAGSFRIILLTSNNFLSLTKLLQSLNDSVHDFFNGTPLHLDIRVDYDDGSMDGQRTARVAEDFEFDHGTKSVHRYDSRQGQRMMWIDAWKPETDDERAVVIEDSLEVSPLWFKWLEKAWDTYGERNDLGAVSLCRQALRASDGSKVSIDTGGKPFLYRLPGSHGFSPKARHWREFVEWAKSVPDLNGADVDVAGTITTQWHREGHASWDQYWVWWCWGSSDRGTSSRSLYNLYVHLPGSASLIKHKTDRSTNLLPASAVHDDEEGEKTFMFPDELERFGWSYERERNNAPVTPK